MTNEEMLEKLTDKFTGAIESLGAKMSMTNALLGLADVLDKISVNLEREQVKNEETDYENQKKQLAVLEEIASLQRSFLDFVKEGVNDQKRERALGGNKKGFLGGIGSVLGGLGTAASGVGDAAKGAGSFLGGIGGGLGSALGGLGKGVGFAGMGIGAAAFGISALMDKIDPEAIKSGVETLLTIGDGYEDRVEFLKDGGGLALALGGIGLALVAFGAGQAAVGIAQFITDDDWATRIKDNVATLLSIGTLTFWDTAGIIATLGGLGLGLAAFAIGEGAEGVTAGIQEAVGKFSGNDSFAARIKDNVETLLSISELSGATWSGVGTFIGVMSGLGLGLAAFAIGEGAEGIAAGVQGAVGLFSEGSNFADRIKTEVETLLSITQLEGVGADTAGFVAIMGGLALGLAAFAYGKGIEGGAEVVQGAVTLFSGESFAERIKGQVSTLLSIVDDADEGKATSFALAMGQIAAGLVAFGGGEFIGTLENAAASIVGFFTGAESPFEQIRQIAENADELTKGADALDRLTVSLDRIGTLQFDGRKLRLREFAEDLMESVPIIESAIAGGTVEHWGLFNDVDFKGLASPDVDYNTAISNITRLREALGVSPEAISRSNAIAEGSAQMSAASITTVAPTQVNTGGNVSNSNNSQTTIINQTVDPYRSLDPALAGTR